MTDPMQVDPAGVRSLGQIHTNVATGLGSLTASSPGAAAVPGSHGTIAAAVDTALTGALGSRSATMGATQSAGTMIAELLHQSALAYERGDQHGGDTIRAAADAIGRGESPAGAGTGASPGGADALGQAVGQLGQLGQMGQQFAAPLAALTQPLQQLPQQIMQGLQQMTQGASGATGSEVTPRPEAGAPRQSGPDERAAEEDPKDETDEPPIGAAPGTPADAGPAPIPPTTERPVPTRPAVD